MLLKRVRHKPLKAISAIIMVILLSSCANVAHLSQSVLGQVELWNKARPVNDVLYPSSQSDWQASEPLLTLNERQRLHYISNVLEFAYQSLSLPNNGSYQSYVPLSEKYVVYNVVVAYANVLKPKVSCYPVIGCQSYRGYYDLSSAKQYAKKMKDKGFDVRVGGVSAYSTLGWFKDPVYSSFFNYDDLELASLLFHELSHQIMYINDDTTFNESFATAIEIYGTEKWLAHSHDNNFYIGYHANEYQIKRDWDSAVLTLIGDYQTKFNQLYENNQQGEVTIANHELLTKKVDLFANLKQDYESLKFTQTHNNDWDNWFNRPLNNADLISVGNYYGLVDAFLEAIEQCDNDLPRFYEFVRKLSMKSYEKRQVLLMSNHSCQP